MAHDEKVARLTMVMVIERLVVGALVGLAPGLTLRLFGAPAGVDGPILRYVGRLFAVRNAVLGVLVWQARHEPERLERLAAINAATEAVDAVAAAVPLARRQGMDRAGGLAMATSLSVMAGFLRLRAAARAAR